MGTRIFIPTVHGAPPLGSTFINRVASRSSSSVDNSTQAVNDSSADENSGTRHNSPEGMSFAGAVLRYLCANPKVLDPLTELSRVIPTQ